MNNFASPQDDQQLNNHTMIDPAYNEPFPVSDSTPEEISLEDFEKLSGTSFIEFLRSQDDML